MGTESHDRRYDSLPRGFAEKRYRLDITLSSSAGASSSRPDYGARHRPNHKFCSSLSPRWSRGIASLLIQRPQTPTSLGKFGTASHLRSNSDCNLCSALLYNRSRHSPSLSYRLLGQPWWRRGWLAYARRAHFNRLPRPSRPGLCSSRESWPRSRARCRKTCSTIESSLSLSYCQPNLQSLTSASCFHTAWLSPYCLWGWSAGQSSIRSVSSSKAGNLSVWSCPRRCCRQSRRLSSLFSSLSVALVQAMVLAF